MTDRMTDPKLYLAIDNCFASKRWTRPSEWVKLIRSMGVVRIEASADNECDPLYMGSDYLEDWMEELAESCAREGASVANFYSGHGTYATLGLSHTDRRVRDRLQDEWLKPMARMAARSGAGLGFYCHAFPEAVLQDPEACGELERDLYARLAEIAAYCREVGVRTPGVEQMYTPHQIPWTIAGARKLLREVYAVGRDPFYLTLDTGHQSAQRKFLRPTAERIRETAQRVRAGGETASLWLGPREAFRIFGEMAGRPNGETSRSIARIEAEMDRCPHLFAGEEDGDPYLWLEQFAAYSPIVHLQQTNGHSSSHLPFTPEYNGTGIIDGKRVLEAIAVAYRRPEDEGMPPRCGELHLTLEIFSGTSEWNEDIVRKMETSVRYWRQFIPRDGMRLSEAVKACSALSS